MDQHHEEEIIRGVLQGDAGAFELLVRAYQGPVYNLALRTIGDPDHAADVAQEAFVRAYEKLGSFKAGKRFFPWLYSIARNLCNDWHRRRGRDALVYCDAAEEMQRAQDLPDEQRAMARRIDADRALECVLRLEEKYREALILRYRHGLSVNETAQAMGIRVSAAKMRVQRGLGMVRDMLEKGAAQ